MEFCLSEEQKLLQESIGGYLEGVSTVEKIRETALSDAPMSQDMFDGLTELGVHAAMIPEEHGGMGMSLLDAALIQEMIGRHAAPVPYFVNAGMAVIGLKGLESFRSQKGLGCAGPRYFGFDIDYVPIEELIKRI